MIDDTWCDSPKDATHYQKLANVVWYKDIKHDTYNYSLDGITWVKGYGRVYGKLISRKGNNYHNYGLRNVVVQGDKMNTISTLRTIRPEDGTVGLCCCPDYAEQIWHTEVSRQDRKKFELITPRAPHGCDVTVRPWSESGVLTRGPSWMSYIIGGCFITALLFALWGAI